MYVSKKCIGDHCHNSCKIVLKGDFEFSFIHRQLLQDHERSSEAFACVTSLLFHDNIFWNLHGKTNSEAKNLDQGQVHSKSEHFFGLLPFQSDVRTEEMILAKIKHSPDRRSRVFLAHNTILFRKKQSTREATTVV
jgi:hypothetical protein